MTDYTTRITTVINGQEETFFCEPRESLLEILRDRLQLTGTKEGCNDGNCGACTVILDGVSVNSCCVLGVEVENATIETIEGLADGNKLHPLQQAFIRETALQCGYCTPGLIMAAKDLLAHEPLPSNERIRLWLANNLCRCTGYTRIIKAVAQAAKELHDKP